MLNTSKFADGIQIIFGDKAGIVVGTPDLQPSYIAGDRFNADVKPQMVLTPFIMLVHRQNCHNSCGIEFFPFESLAFASTNFLGLHPMQDFQNLFSVSWVRDYAVRANRGLDSLGYFDVFMKSEVIPDPPRACHGKAFFQFCYFAFQFFCGQCS